MGKPPTTAALALHPLLELLPGSPERMVVARLAEIDKSPHAGLTVAQGRVSCECVLALVAATEKTKGNAFGAGFRVITKRVVDCDIWLTEDGGGAQSAADIGFGYFNGNSSNTAAFGGIGYTMHDMTQEKMTVIRL